MPISAASARRTSPTRSSSASQLGAAEQRVQVAADFDRERVDADQPERGLRPAHRLAPALLAPRRARRRPVASACARPARGAERGDPDGARTAGPETPARRPAPNTSTAATRSTSGRASSCAARSTPSAPSPATRVTIIPIAVEIRNAGSVVSSALPIERMANVSTAVGRRHAVVERADHDPAQQVEHHDHQRRDGVALDELAGPVHRGVEIGLALHPGALGAGAVRVEHAGVQVGVDRHLLAGHRVEREAGADLGDPLRAAGDDHELDRDQDREHDQPDHHVAAHDELAEGRKQRADPVHLVALREDEPGGAHVEREPEQRRQQQRGREGRELERLLDPQRDQQHQRRAEHVERQQRVEQRRRQRDDENRDDPEHRDREAGGQLGVHASRTRSMPCMAASSRRQVAALLPPRHAGVLQGKGLDRVGFPSMFFGPTRQALEPLADDSIRHHSDVLEREARSA